VRGAKKAREKQQHCYWVFEKGFLGIS